MGLYMACLITLLAILGMTFYIWFQFKSRVREEFNINVALPMNACDKLLPQDFAQQYRNRILKATNVTHPELDHRNYHYCYVRDFDLNAASDFAPVCEKEKSEVYSNQMIKRIFPVDVKDQDSQIGIPRRVCMMEILPDRMNEKNIRDFYKDIQKIENVQLAKELQECKATKVLQHKENVEIKTELDERVNKITAMNRVIEEEAILAQTKQAELQLALLQPRSNNEGRVFVLDEKGNIVIESAESSQHDLSNFKDRIFAVILPTSKQFTVSIYDKTDDTYVPKTIKETISGVGLYSIRAESIDIQKRV